MNITGENGPLNAFQRRLVYQIVRNDFPNLRTFARHEQSFMQVVKVDIVREAEVCFKSLTSTTILSYILLCLY